MARFEKLFEPIQVGSMVVKNRLVMPGMGTNYASPEGFVTERIKDYYAARAGGGVGLIIVESTCIDTDTGRSLPCQLAIDDDKFITGLRELAQTIKNHGAKAAIQLAHGGGSVRPALVRGRPVAPSPIARPGYAVPHELTAEEIRLLVARFAAAAERAQRAGFDGVEIHAAHLHLLSQFLSSAWNQRQDIYGGTTENRARFLVEVIEAMKNKVGRAYPIWCRLNVAEFDMKGGMTVEECQKVVTLLENAGSDSIHVSAFYRSPSQIQSWSMPFARGNLIPLAEAIKKTVHIPVIAVGRIDPELAEQVLQDGKADLVAIGRQLLADPTLPSKVAADRLEDIRPCTACWGCFETVYFGSDGVRCQVNAGLGREQKYSLALASKRKRVLVVGGGPAGLEAARVAALRGHTVTLIEREQTLGGQLREAIVPPSKERLKSLLDYLICQVTKLGVEVRLKTVVTPATVESNRPDVLIVATGVVSVIPEIPGIENTKVILAGDVLFGKHKTGDRVVIVGGELVGCETADFLAEMGKSVTVVRRGPEIAAGVRPPVIRDLLLQRLHAQGVALIPGVRYEAIVDSGLVVTTAHGVKQLLEADTIVLATGSRPEDHLYHAVKHKVPQALAVGDCVQPRNIMSAIAEGFNAGFSI